VNIEKVCYINALEVQNPPTSEASGSKVGTQSM